MVEETSTSPTHRRHRIIRVGKFGAVGVLNTAIDFTIYNVLYAVFGLHLLVANLISTTIAMIFSFFANRNLVFKAQAGHPVKQAVLFLLVTGFGLYVLQLGTLHLLTSVWTGPVNVATSIVHTLGLGNTFSDTFVRNNAAKVVATLVSLVWNYIVYKRVVFR
jgi:putative flippase GtrA